MDWTRWSGMDSTGVEWTRSERREAPLEWIENDGAERTSIGVKRNSIAVDWTRWIGVDLNW
eukprot:661173-Pleurochrysis_carterae.AAC.1